jgi:hypothetical protein
MSLNLVQKSIGLICRYERMNDKMIEFENVIGF